MAPISTRPTHVIVLPAPVRAGAGSGDKVGDLAPGTTVVVVRSEGGWTLVARDGREVGFVNAGSLLALQ